MNYIIKIHDIYQDESEALRSPAMPLSEVTEVLPQLLKPSMFGRNFYRITVIPTNQPTIQEILESGAHIINDSVEFPPTI